MTKPGWRRRRHRCCNRGTERAVSSKRVKKQVPAFQLRQLHEEFGV
jgi:hypothetical protein